MPIYLVTYDMRDMSHDYEALVRTLREGHGHQAQPTAWLIESPKGLNALSTGLLALMAKTDSLFVVEIAPGTPWAATRLDDGAGEWLKSRRP
jgi:hypothetical protein